MDDVEYVELHGERVAYRDAGVGEVMVLIHGIAGSSDTWQEIIPLLSHRYRVIAPDLLGHGRSGKPRTDYSLGAFAASLRDLLDRLGVDRVTIVGHSLGGGVAMQFLYQHPEYCQRLILISSGGLGPDVGWMLRVLSAPGAEFVLPFIAPRMVLAIGNRVRSWLRTTPLGSLQSDQNWQAHSSLSDPATRAAFLRTLRSVVDHRGQSVSALSRLGLGSDVPTLVIWGDRDSIIPVSHGYAVHAARPNSTLTVLAGRGHVPHIEAPIEVATAIDEFVTGNHLAEIARRERGIAGDTVPSEQLSRPFENLVGDLTERAHVETAVGLLMGLRGCAHAEASHEFGAAAADSGLAAAELAEALVELAGGQGADSSPHRVHVHRHWGNLLAGRGLEPDSRDRVLPNDVRVRYGPTNNTTIC